MHELVTNLSMIEKLAPVLFKFVRALWDTSKSDAELAKATNEQYQDWLIELNQVLEKLLDQHENLEARVTELSNDLECCRVQRNYCFEAMREAIDERRHMLAFAFVGSFFTWATSSASTLDLSRAERTIRDLDPDDVRFLADIRNGVEERNRDFEDDSTREIQTSNDRWPTSSGELDRDLYAHAMKSASGEALLAAGCLKQLPAGNAAGAIEAIRLTTRGELVLRVLEFYLASVTPQLSAP